MQGGNQKLKLQQSRLSEDRKSKEDQESVKENVEDKKEDNQEDC